MLFICFVVDILGSIDEKIENNERLSKTIEESALLKYDLLVKNQTLTTYTMADFFDISIGKTPPRKESHWFTSKPNDVKWLSISDLGKSKIFCFDSSEKIKQEGVEKYSVKVVPSNTVILSFKLTVGKVAITACDMATNEAIAHFNTEDKTIQEYLYCYLRKYNFDTLGNTSSIATAVNSKALRAMAFSVPDNEKICKFHEDIKPLFDKIRHCMEENLKLNELKQLYLKKFFG